MTGVQTCALPISLLDGSSKIGNFFRLILPMSAAPIATISLLTFISSWNDYFWPLMVSYSENSRGPHRRAGGFPFPDPQHRSRLGGSHGGPQSSIRARAWRLRAAKVKFRRAAR